MARYLPIVLGVLVIVGLTIPQIVWTDRLSGTNVSAETRAELLKKVPTTVGDWHGEDKSIDKQVRETAGAIGAVSRTYRNSRTGEMVDLWLIVGHARDVSFHTPDVCYTGSGFLALADTNSLYKMDFQDQPRSSTPFLTNTFRKEDITGQHLVRVFWTWYNPDDSANNGKVVWDAPSNPRWRFGNARALYKMYFTSYMRDPKELPNESVCERFARDFLPEVSKALAEVYGVSPGAAAENKPGATPASAERATVAAPLVESPTSATSAPDVVKTDAPATAKSGTETPPTKPAAAGEKSGVAESLFDSLKATK